MNKNEKIAVATVAFSMGVLAGIQSGRIQRLKKDLAIGKIQIDLLKRCFKTAVEELTPEQAKIVEDKLDIDLEFAQITHQF